MTHHSHDMPAVVCLRLPRYVHVDAAGVKMDDCCTGTLLPAPAGSTFQQCCASGVVDAAGHCCSSPLTVDGCGVCGGSGIGIDASGVCCSGDDAALDAQGRCCTAGVDTCGVCGGASDTCGLQSTLDIVVPAAACNASYSTSANLFRATPSGASLAASVQRAAAAALGVRASDVVVGRVSCAGVTGPQQTGLALASVTVAVLPVSTPAQLHAPGTLTQLGLVELPLSRRLLGGIVAGRGLAIGSPATSPGSGA